MTIERKDLKLTHYLWSEPVTKNRQDITPSRKLFDRNNGTHVLWLANWYALEFVPFGSNELDSWEKLIFEKLPQDLRSEISVCHWLMNTHS